MINKNDILKMVRHIAKRSEHIPDRKLMHPARDWFIGLSIAALMFVSSAAFAFMTFHAQSEKVNRVVPVTETVAVYKGEKARAVLELYNERINTFNALRSKRIDGGVTLPATPEQDTTSQTEGAIIVQ